MITLEHDRLVFRFPEVHEDAVCTIYFQRTLRIPDDGKDYPLPPGLGSFPLRHLDDHARRLPDTWLKRGGVMLPMYQAEAMWRHFGANRGWDGYPFAVYPKKAERYEALVKARPRFSAADSVACFSEIEGIRLAAGGRIRVREGEL